MWSYNMEYFMYWTADVKSKKLLASQVQKQLINCVYRSLNTFRTSTGFEPMTSWYRCDGATNWSFVGHMEPVRNECEVIICSISYIELRMWNQVSYVPRRYKSKLCNCVYRSRKKSGLQRGLNPYPRDTGAMVQPTEPWSHWRWELVMSGS